MTKKSIEDFFKDTFENFEADVKPSVWANIQTGLKGVGIGLLVKMAINKIGTNTLITIVTSVVAVASIVVMVTWDGHSTKPKPVAINKNVVTPNPSADVKLPGTATNNNNAVADNKTTKTEDSKTAVNMPVKGSDNTNHIVVKPYSGAPIASIFANPTSGTVPLIVNFSNTGVGKTNKWKYGDSKKEDRAANPTHVFEKPGNYSVILVSIDATGISSSDTLKIIALKNPDMSSVPVEITPNGDGERDAFGFNNDNRIIKMNVQIFDRVTGKKVFERDGGNFSWEGKSTSGDDLKEGDYFYYTTGEGKTTKKSYERKGYIRIKR